MLALEIAIIVIFFLPVWLCDGIERLQTVIIAFVLNLALNPLIHVVSINFTIAIEAPISD